MEDRNNKPYIDSEKCVGCSLCIENCPQDCIELSKPKFQGDIHIYAFLCRANECISCGLCAKACPIKIIKISR